MGRHLKNRSLKTASYSVRLPMGTNVIGPDSPVDGLFRFNKSIDSVEIYYDNNWRQISSQLNGLKESAKDTFIGDGYTRSFGPMRASYQTGQEIKILVFIGNVFQNPGVAYQVDGDIIEFSSVPPDGHTIIVLHGFSR